jgi:hypothetical protein
MQNAQKVTITYKFTGKPEFLMGEMSMLTPEEESTKRFQQ